MSCFLLLGYTFIEPYWLIVNTIPFVSSDIPPSFDGTTIVFVSDIHHGPFFGRWRVANLVERINRLQPDIVVFGGDYVHRHAKYIVPCFKELRHVTAPLGVFGVLGNHDHWEDAELTRQQMSRAGITILDNLATWIVQGQERIKIGGVGDLWEDLQDVRPTLEDTDDSDFVILVSHNPDYAEFIPTRNIDLMLCGHTHGGQVTFFGKWAPFVPSQYGQKYRYGLIETPKTRVIVTKGVGTVTPPVRFFARPEIVEVKLKHE
ncbi:metallophosphoesterase [candidate division KSB3 bacterium]|uniref:Metallophosphoesterase n=1 Tax=candidate division KSB3 bacterium TaxID=2044937 RepID=A0A2G6KC71_9BACT|nr:MAG: metallophosphoesterase [candidate division KSB3 bacterium]